jgi:hypothetical protein
MMLVYASLILLHVYKHSHNFWTEPSMLRRRPFGLYNLHASIIFIPSSMPRRRHASCYVVDQWSQQMWNWLQQKLRDSHFKEENDPDAYVISPRTSQYSTISCQFHEIQIYRDSNSGKYVQCSWDTNIIEIETVVNTFSMLTFQNNSKTCLKDQMMLVSPPLNILAYIPIKTLSA